MAEVHEIHEIDEVEVPVVEKRRPGFVLPLIMFLLGGAIITAVVVAVLNVQGTIAWPAGQVSLGPNGTVADAGYAQVAPPVSATDPSAVAPSVTPDVSASADSEPQEATPPPATTPPAVTDESATQPPAETATPSEPQ
jgi:hypothetical protein